MDSEKTFQIHLDPDLIEQFHELLGEHEHVSEQISFIEKTFVGKKYRGLSAWDCICSCEHRIRDTVAYLNEQVLATTDYEYRSAFDFINFINNAATVIDCVDMLARIFGVDFSEENVRTEAFSQLGNNGRGTDQKYFRFIRSLCAVHPVETSRYADEYQSSELVTCPYLTWVKEPIFKTMWDCDLHANAFTNTASTWGDDVCIHMDQVFDYIEFRYGLLEKVIDGLERFQQEAIDKFRSTPIPGRGEGEAEDEFIERLKGVELERFGSNNDFIYDFAKKAVTFVPSNKANLAAARRYAEAWRFAISLQLNILRDMSREGIEHAGTDNDDTDWILFEHLLYSSSGAKELREFGYNLEKIHYLDGTSGPSDSR